MAPYYGLPLKYSTEDESENDITFSYESSYASHMEENEDLSQKLSEKLEENIEDARDIDFEKYFSGQKSNGEQDSGDFELSSLSAHVFPDIGSPPPEKCVKSNIKTKVFRGPPTEKFVWNSYILEGLKKIVHPDWLLNITHGFVGQSSNDMIHIIYLF